MGPAVYRAFLKLDSLAQTGDYNSDLLRELQSVYGVTENRTTAYYLASLYLQLGDESSAKSVLSDCGPPTSQMKKYCAVLHFCKAEDLPLPKLTTDELSCLDYLARVVNPEYLGMDQLVYQYNGFSIVGNAPSENKVQDVESTCKFYFNSYKKNQRITHDATVHVVTPSWNSAEINGSQYLCITGNNIFYRRSRVWRKFIDNHSYRAVFTFPRALWAGLYKELNASPSAGLLTLSYIRSILQSGGVVAEGYVAGFSVGEPVVNHDYDSEPASARHDWVAERVRCLHCIDQLRQHCSRFTSEV